MSTEHPHQFDGTFSDVIEDDSHPLHPKADFEHRAEFNEDGLRRSLTHAFATIPGTQAVRFPREALVEALEDARDQATLALAYLAAETGEPEERKHAKDLLRGMERIFRWMLEEGRADAYTFCCRGAVVAFMLCPSAFGVRQQIDLLKFLGMSHKQSLGRYVSEFREKFGYFSPLMRSEAAIRSFKIREQKKRQGKGKA